MAANGLVQKLISWVTGGVSTRLDFIERDLETLDARTERLTREHEGAARVLASHEQRLNRHDVRIESNAAQMIALRRMHGALAERLGRPFPEKLCDSCGAPMIFDRSASQKAYTLQCPKRCGPELLLPEDRLLQTFQTSVD